MLRAFGSLSSVTQAKRFTSERAGSSTISSPSSIALARTTSSSAVSRATLPISLRYIRTGSSMPMRSAARASRSSSPSLAAPAGAGPGGRSSSSGSPMSVGWFCASRTSTPASSAAAYSSSTAPMCASGSGMAARIWSWVMKPSSRPRAMRSTTAAEAAPSSPAPFLPGRRALPAAPVFGVGGLRAAAFGAAAFGAVAFGGGRLRGSRLRGSGLRGRPSGGGLRRRGLRVAAFVVAGALRLDAAAFTAWPSCAVAFGFAAVAAFAGAALRPSSSSWPSRAWPRGAWLAWMSPRSTSSSGRPATAAGLIACSSCSRSRCRTWNCRSSSLMSSLSLSSRPPTLMSAWRSARRSCTRSLRSRRSTTRNASRSVSRSARTPRARADASRSRARAAVAGSRVATNASRSSRSPAPPAMALHAAHSARADSSRSGSVSPACSAARTGSTSRSVSASRSRGLRRGPSSSGTEAAEIGRIGIGRGPRDSSSRRIRSSIPASWASTRHIRVALDAIGNAAQQVEHATRVRAATVRLAQVHLARGALHEVRQQLLRGRHRRPPAVRIGSDQLVGVLAGGDADHPHLAHDGPSSSSRPRCVAASPARSTS